LKSLSQQVRELLDDGPATAREIADELMIETVRAKVGLKVLKKQGHVRVAGSVLNTESVRGQPKQLKIYELTLRGRACMRRYKDGT